MIIIPILWIIIRKDRLHQLSFDEQCCVFNDMLKKDFFGHVIGGPNAQTNLTGIGTHGQSFEDEITPDPFFFFWNLFVVHVMFENGTEFDDLFDT